MHVELNSPHPPPQGSNAEESKASSHRHLSEEKKDQLEASSGGRRDLIDLDSKQTAIAEAEEEKGSEADPDPEEKMEDFLVEVSASPRRVTKWTMVKNTHLAH